MEGLEEGGGGLWPGQEDLKGTVCTLEGLRKFEAIR